MPRSICAAGEPATALLDDVVASSSHPFVRDLTPQDLAYIGLGQIVAELAEFRFLVCRDLGLTESHQLFNWQRWTLAYDRQLDRPARVLARYTDAGTFEHDAY